MEPPSAPPVVGPAASVPPVEVVSTARDEWQRAFDAAPQRDADFDTMSGVMSTPMTWPSDPTCSEHPPSDDGISLHAAACHACLFVPETTCERGNRYLDRATLVRTLSADEIDFFSL